MKSHFEQYMTIVINFLHELMKSPQENVTESGSSLVTFDVKIFPYIKLISLILLILLFGRVVKNILEILTKEKENNPGKIGSDITKSFVLTLPDLSEKSTRKNAVKLKGRIKRNPNPINYNELFDTKKTSSEKEKPNYPLIKSKFDESSKNNITNHYENKPQKVKEDSLCSYDDLFDFHIPEQKNSIIEK